MKCYVWSTLLYGCKTWVLKKETTNSNNLRSGLYRRMLKIMGYGYTLNSRVLEMVSKKIELMTTGSRRSLAIYNKEINIPLHFTRLALYGKIAGEDLQSARKVNV